MVKRDPTIISLLTLTKREVTVMALRQGEYPPCHRGQMLALTHYELMVVLMVLGKSPKAFSFFSYTKRKKIIY